MKGKTVPVYAGMPILIKIANSMIATSKIGSTTDRSTSAMIRNTKPMDTALTTAKSWSVIVIRSFVHGASPMSIEPSS